MATVMQMPDRNRLPIEVFLLFANLKGKLCLIFMSTMVSRD